MVYFRPIGRHPYLFKTARIVGPQINELAIFSIKRTPFLIGILYWKLGQIGPIGRPLFCQNGPQYGAPNTGVGKFYNKTDPPLNLYFKIGSFGDNWQNPIYPKWLVIWGLKYMSWQIFS